MFSIITNIHYCIKLFKKYLGVKIYLIFFLSLFAALSEGIGILMILPLLSGLNESADLVNQSNFLATLILDAMKFLGLEINQVNLLGFIGFFFLLKGFITFGALSISAVLVGRLQQQIKREMFFAYSRMNFDYYLSKNTGYFTNVINEQTNSAMRSFQQLTSLMGNIITALVLTGIAFLLTWIFGTLAFIFGILLLILFTKLNNYVRNLSRLTAHENGIFSKWLIQFLQGMKYLKATSQTTSIEDKVINSIDYLTSYQIKSGVASALTQALREPIAVGFIIFIVILQSIYLGLPLEPILVSIVLFYRGLNGFLAVQTHYQGTFQYLGSMELIDREFGEQKKHEEPQGAISIKSFKNSIDFQSVEFSYDKTKKVLDKANIIFHVNKSTALIGNSGSGKTTIINLIALLHEPSSGRIIIDGINSVDIESNSWREKIGYVSQETVIFDDTIANNISLWKSDSNTLSKIRIAAKEANLLDFIEDLPDGFDTRVGDRGLLLSGGQRQRLFIARELFRNPEILILDEATSALDSNSEKEIQNAIDSLRGKITLIIIAHRLSTIKDVDSIHYLENGKIIMSGSFEEISKKDKFKELIRIQNL